jgi:hypothetical protein
VLPSNAQDTLKHTTGPCIGTDVMEPCPPGINFYFHNDSLDIFGTIYANCCGEHFIAIDRSEGYIRLHTFDTGMLCTCTCKFCFKVVLPASVLDTVVEINGHVYRTINAINEIYSNNCIELYPNPAETNLLIKTRVGAEIVKYSIFQVQGTMVRSSEYKTNLIELEGLSPGVYFIQFELSNSQLVGKRIVLQ